jgi:hypothetical protein
VLNDQRAFEELSAIDDAMNQAYREPPESTASIVRPAAAELLAINGVKIAFTEMNRKQIRRNMGAPCGSI